EAGDKGETFARESGWNRYTITVKNIGQTTSLGKVTVTDQLPAGMMLAGAFNNKPEPISEKPDWTCKILSGLAGLGPNDSAVECSTEKPLAEQQPFSPITLHVTVASQAANPSTNVATVSGGGAAGTQDTGEQGQTTA